MMDKELLQWVEDALAFINDMEPDGPDERVEGTNELADRCDELRERHQAIARRLELPRWE
jgi:hypothetical protein